MNNMTLLNNVSSTGKVAIGLSAAIGLTSTFTDFEVAAAESEKPNVIFISVDDWNDWVGAFGENQAITPNLDKLVDRGVGFNYAHCASVFSAPSRSALMTGQYPHRTGAYNHQLFFYNTPELVDIPRLFQQSGYETAGGGKLYHHVAGWIDMRGWDTYFHWYPEMKKNGWGYNAWSRKAAPMPEPWPNSKFANDKLKKRPKGKPTFFDYAALPNENESKMADSITTDWAVDFLEGQHDKPFFLGYGLYSPHKPNFAPKKYFDLYPIEDIKLPPIKMDDMDDLPPKLKARFANRYRQWKQVVDAGEQKEYIQAYLACISYADAQIGRVLDALEDSEYADNTIVVLWSDNGYHHGEKTINMKHTLWERTSNVPLIWAGPGITKGAVVDSAVSLVDIYPTLVDMCGLEAPQELDGVSLKNVLADPMQADEDRFVIQCNEMGEFSLISKQWRFTQHQQNEYELYDLSNDPNEWYNLAYNKKYADVVAKFKAMLPKHVAEPGIKTNQLELKFTGETYEWVAKKGKSKGKHKGKAKGKAKKHS